MSEQGQFDLCPKCGAIARDGVCQSCGHEISEVKDVLEQQHEVLEQQNDVYASTDVYQSQSSQEIYQTPDTNSDSVTENMAGGLFSGEQQPENADNIDSVDNAYYGNSYVGNQNNTYNSNPYAANQNNSYPYDHAYNNNQMGNNQSANGQYANSYGNNTYGNNAYGNNTYGNNQNNNHPYSGNQNAYGNNSYTGNAQYNGNNQYTGNNAYGNGQYGNNPYGNPNGYNQYSNNPYSPYAAPQSKKHTGLIIGVIIGAVVLFLIAFFALIYNALKNYSDEREVSYYSYDENERDDFDFDYDDYDYDYDEYDYDDDYYDDYDDYNYDDYDDEGYYTLHDDIKYDLSYSIEWEYFEYETDLENVSIAVDYPVIVGDDVPNLDKLNAEIAEEAEFFTEYFEEEYIDYMDEEEGYFGVYAAGYVTYMDEDILSIVFSEDIYTDYFGSVSLYCINIDMENGVILDNNDLIDVDDEFSVDFRTRSERQNGTIEGLDAMSDQEITEYLSSSNLIVFYIPQGMEIGLNYDDGWVTVTYEDYEDYLNIF